MNVLPLTAHIMPTAVREQEESPAPSKTKSSPIPKHINIIKRHNFETIDILKQHLKADAKGG